MHIIAICLFVLSLLSLIVFLRQKSRFVRALDEWKELDETQRPHIDMLGKATGMLFPALAVFAVSFLLGLLFLILWMVL